MESSNFQAADNSNAIDLAYSRAVLYSALAIGFQPPTKENLSRLVTAHSISSLADAAALLYPGRADLVAAIEALPGSETVDLPQLRTSYRILFGHTAQGRISPYETEYGNEALFQQPQELGDLMGFYRAFGLALKLEHHERPDHLGCECEFLMFLALKEAFALGHRDREMLQETRKAQRLFLRDHLARFVPAFVTRLSREDPDGLYGCLGEMALRFIRAECARFDVQPGVTNLGLRAADDNRIPMACGNGTECAAMAGAGVPDGGDSL
jgi:DMSO reductase family type II enzyme chaperone